MSTFNDDQLKVLAVVPIVSSILSILGSSSILYVIISRRKIKLSKTYHRILLCMSIMDIVQSLAHAFSTAAIPSGTEGVFGAIGNVGTCTAQGFFITLGYAVPLYNVALSFYYLVSVFDQRWTRGLEKFSHMISLGVPTCLAIAGLIGNNFNNLGTICFFNEFPRHCNNDPNVECSRGSDSKVYQYIIGIFLIVALVILPINMFLLCLIVNRQHNKMYKKYIKQFKIRRIDSKHNKTPRKKKHRICFFFKVESTQSRKVVVQASCYVSAFLLTFLGTIIDAIIWNYAPDKRCFILVLICKIFYPIQGLFNFLIFIRPRIIRLRKNNPRLWFPFIIIKAVLGEKGDVDLAKGSSAYKNESHAAISPSGIRNRTDCPESSCVHSSHQNSVNGQQTGKMRSKIPQKRDSLIILDIVAHRDYLQDISISDSDDDLQKIDRVNDS